MRRKGKALGSMLPLMGNVSATAPPGGPVTPARGWIALDFNMIPECPLV
jgi:hypothetical protein